VTGKAKEVGVRVTVGAVEAAPVPARATVCGVPVALSATDRLAVSAPAAAGLNSTDTVQLAAAARVVPQVVADLRKDVALVPVMVSDVSVTVPVPVFLMVTSCAAVVEPNVVDAKVSAAGDSETVKVEAAVPVPVKATVCGVPVALSAIDRLAVSAPVAAGLNSTDTVQLAAAARVVPQVVADLRKDVALVPVTVSDVRVTVPVPVFLMVTSCAAVVEPTVVEAKVRAVGESETVKVGAAAPVPVRATVCGVPVALSAIDRLAVSVPVAAGLNSTDTVQLAAAARVVPQVVADLRNDVALVPVTVSDVSVTVPVPVFLMVTTCAAEAVPTVVDAKVIDVGESEMVGVVLPDPPVTVKSLDVQKPPTYEKTRT